MAVNGGQPGSRPIVKSRRFRIEHSEFVERERENGRPTYQHGVSIQSSINLGGWNNARMIFIFDGVTLQTNQPFLPPIPFFTSLG